MTRGQKPPKATRRPVQVAARGAAATARGSAGKHAPIGTASAASAPENRTIIKKAAWKWSWQSSLPSTSLEIIVIGIWALWVGNQFLNFDPHVISPGNEFGVLIQSNHFWTQLQQCGWCALWNGSEQGGLPALVDLQGSLLHPAVAIPALLFGVVNGAKVTILLALWLAGVAQWWIAHELDLGLLPRFFSAAVAVAGGHLAARMQTGNVPLVLSTAMASLMVAAAFHFVHRGGIRAGLLLALGLASLLVAGNGYMQIATASILPAFLILVLTRQHPLVSFWRDLLVATVVGLLLAAPMLVPLAHFAPEFSKGTDPGTFSAAQPLEYIPLNLIIADPAFFGNQSLGKLPVVDLYGLFIGWVPVLLAFVGLVALWGYDRRHFFFFAAGVALSFFTASAILQRSIVALAPRAAAFPLVGGFRFPSVAAAMSVPFILGLSALGLQSIWRAAKVWPRLIFAPAGTTAAGTFGLPLRWLILVPLLYALHSSYEFAQPWYRTVRQDDNVYRVVDSMRTASLAWVEPSNVFGFFEPAVAIGLKLSPGYSGVQWKNRELPKPSLIASWSGAPAESIREVSVVEGVGIYDTGEIYAGVRGASSIQPCSATGSGGNLTISCQVSQPGRLEVKESFFPGWRAWIDGTPAAVVPAAWLGVDMPVGTHTVVFRYLPWDVPVGLALMACGVAASIWLTVRSRRRA